MVRLTPGGADAAALPALAPTPRYHRQVISSRGRALATRLFSPVARGLLRLGIGPDLVTVAGTVAVVAAALWFLPRGQFVAGPLVIAACALFDSVDGLMARELQRRGVARSQDFGAFLDSTLDRVADAAIFVGLVLYFLRHGPDQTGILLALGCLVFGSVVPYARARAEGLGMTAAVGIAERADRIILVLVGIFAVGLGAPGWVLTAVLGVLAVASAVTVLQRVVTVRRQALARLASAAEQPAPAAPPEPAAPLPARPLLGSVPWQRSRRALRGTDLHGTEPVRRRRFRVLAPRTGSSARRPR